MIRVNRPKAQNLLAALTLAVCLAVSAGSAYAAPDALVIADGTDVYKMRPHFEVFLDPDKKLGMADIAMPEFAGKFTQNRFIGWTGAAVWYHASVVNSTGAAGPLYLQLAHPWASVVELYQVEANGSIRRSMAGDQIPFAQWTIPNPLITFEVPLVAGEKADLYVRIVSEDLAEFPIVALTAAGYHRYNTFFTIFMWFFVGASVALLSYNFLLYYSLRDTNYLYYALYLAAMTVLTLSLKGISFQYFWPESVWWGNKANHLFGSLVQITGVLFTMRFLSTAETLPHMNRWLKGYAAAHAVFIPLIYVSPYFTPVSVFTEVSPLFFDVLLLITGVQSLRLGNRSARYYLIAFVFTLAGMAIFILGVLGAIPYGLFADNVMEAGFLLEMVLLSLALADRISIIQRERELAQSRALEQEKLVKVTLENANVELERKVEERTRELSESQRKLVQTEKMAALGQLIAGIAHEINTPLGAIRASVGNIHASLDGAMGKLPGLLASLPPERIASLWEMVGKAGAGKLNLSAREERELRGKITTMLEKEGVAEADVVADMLVDMELFEGISGFAPALKEDTHLLSLNVAYDLVSLRKNSFNIGMAVEKAAKVVFALKKYVHHDHSGKMTGSAVTEGLETVLTLYHHNIKHGVEVVKDYRHNPLVLCHADEIHQVWTNLIHNALHAMGNKGRLEIRVAEEGETAVVTIADSGHGIPPDIMERIFEPFFTTKPKGEGSGLGLDIVKKIIDKHNGRIMAESRPGRTVFTVVLPLYSNGGASRRENGE
ncbi:MAG: GHKL domain-containing protein [Nitrospinae bacterium]|nr:GHKL domain-containing protein [Nitrospinota bacterium]